MQGILRSICAVALVLALARCSATPAESGPPSARALPRIDSVEWRCVWLVDAAGVAVNTSDRPPTLRVAPDGKASGFAGVNRFFASATFGSVIAQPEPLRIGPVGATRMAGPPERMALEHAFTAMLESVRFSEVKSGANGPLLVLSTEHGEVARFKPVTADPTAD
jgi:heat shock protein HslJ